MDLDEDPYLIDSWEEYCKTCIKESNLKLFKSKLGSYIEHTNSLIQAELEAYINKLWGDMIAQELLEQKIKKKRFPNI